MSVQSDPLPPVPEHTPPAQEDANSPSPGKYFNHVWTRWFTSLREKVNVISEAMVNLEKLSDSGLVTKDGNSWGAQPLDRLIPSGGSTDQVLTKSSNDDYKTVWKDQTGGGASGGILPMVNGETPPIMMYGGNQLIYARVE